MIDGGMTVPNTSFFTLQLPLSVRQPKPDQGDLHISTVHHQHINILLYNLRTII